MARKAGQIVARGASTWLVRVYLGRDPQTGTRKYHNQTIHGPFREAQRFLNLKLQQRDKGRVSRAAVTQHHGAHQALAQIYQRVQQQASLLSYVDIISLFGLACVCMTPVAFLMKKAPKGGEVVMH
jgi:hypothetical protein